MAIETDSEQWQSSEEIGKTVQCVYNWLDVNKDMAYTAPELATNLLPTSPDTCAFLPEPILRAYSEGNTEPLVSHISSVLEYLRWWGVVECRVVSEGDEQVRYYTFSLDGMHPVWKVQNYKQRIQNLEEKVNRLESQTHEESDPDLNSGDLEQEIEDSKRGVGQDTLDSIHAIRSINNRFNDIDEEIAELRHDLYCTSDSIATRFNQLESQLQEEGTSNPNAGDFDQKIENIEQKIEAIEEEVGETSQAIEEAMKLITSQFVALGKLLKEEGALSEAVTPLWISDGTNSNYPCICEDCTQSAD